KPVRVNSNWPDVFRPLVPRLEVDPFMRRANRIAHYITRKQLTGTTQFEDCCINGGITDYKQAELKLDWTPVNPDWSRQLRERAEGRPIVAVQMPRAPMN